jgi:predicted oxidoreductase (fatty acid repression mutant protein)
MAEEIFQNLPKYFKSWSETAVVLGRDLVDRVWDLKAEVERRITEMNNKKYDTKKVTQRPTSRSKFFVIYEIKYNILVLLKQQHKLHLVMIDFLFGIFIYIFY